MMTNDKSLGSGARKFREYTTKPKPAMETPARLAIEIADHHLADGTVEQRRDLARAILNAIGVCEKEVASEIVKANSDGILAAASMRVAVTDFAKALSLPDGPSLAVQRHNPSWEAWKTLCDASAAAAER